MSTILLFSPKSIGPVWPAMLLCLAFMATTSVFLVLARFRSLVKCYTLREYRFLQRLYDATEMFSALAILSGMVGTCLGLVQVLPALSNALQSTSSESLLQQVLGPLRHVWVSTIAGLVLGGLWGEALLFVLKPYTRPALMPVSAAEPPAPPLDLPGPETPGPEDDPDPDEDWRKDDIAGMY